MNFEVILSGARKNDVYAMRRFARNSSSARRIRLSMDTLSKLWEFYRLRPFAGNTQSVHIVSFPARRARSCRSSGHPMIYTSKIVILFSDESFSGFDTV